MAVRATPNLANVVIKLLGVPCRSKIVMIQQPFYEGKLSHFRSLSMNISCPQIGIFGNPRKSCPQKCPVLHNRFCRTLNLRRIIGVTMLKMYNMYHLYITLGRPFVCWEGFQLHLGYIHSHSIVLTI